MSEGLLSDRLSSRIPCTGVILSTAFIHLLSDAFANLLSLRTFGYKNWPGAILCVPSHKALICLDAR